MKKLKFNINNYIINIILPFLLETKLYLLKLFILN